MAEETNFVDYVKIYARSGKGGRGSAHFRREKYIPKGGPDGGNGGDGGHVYLRGNRNLWTLLHLHCDRHIFATPGNSGGANNRTGANGEDRIIELPLGTAVYDAETGKYICDLREDGQEISLLRGGRGGKGNTFFKTSTNQAPRYAQPGEPAQEGAFILQLKTLADVGLVGLPNAGKSTLLSTLTAAKPKIADYPFTTLEPSIGIVAYRENRSFVMADIPGIIEGAAEGKGLGLRFLRHIERNAVLLFTIPADSEDISATYRTLLGELEQYNPELLNKHRVLAITKSDLIDEEIQEWLRGELPNDLPAVFISAVSRAGLGKLKDILWAEIEKENIHQSDDIIFQDLDLSRLSWEDDTPPSSYSEDNEPGWDPNELEVDWD